jgi:hypothetical protein
VRKEIEQAYERLFEDLYFPPFHVWLEQHREIADAIRTASETLGVRVRPDAKLALLINFHVLVWLPLRLSSREDKKIDMSKILDGILKDIPLILKSAEALSSSSQSAEREISSHLVFEAALKKWRTMAVNEFKIWVSFLTAILGMVLSAQGITDVYKSGYNGDWNNTSTKRFQWQAGYVLISIVLLSFAAFFGARLPPVSEDELQALKDRVLSLQLEAAATRTTTLAVVQELVELRVKLEASVSSSSARTDKAK